MAREDTFLLPIAVSCRTDRCGHMPLRSTECQAPYRTAHIRSLCPCQGCQRISLILSKGRLRPRTIPIGKAMPCQEQRLHRSHHLCRHGGTIRREQRINPVTTGTGNSLVQIIKCAGDGRGRAARMGQRVQVASNVSSMTRASTQTGHHSISS
jgi:hypothetical protein